MRDDVKAKDELRNYNNRLIYLSLKHFQMDFRQSVVARNQTPFPLINSLSLLNISWQSRILAKHICKLLALIGKLSRRGGIRGILRVVLDELNKRVSAH